MSDIPIGSPPVPPGRHAAPGGWYPDPLDPGQERYWDGWQWSRNTRASEKPVSPPGPAAQPWPGQYPPQYPSQYPSQYPPQAGQPYPQQPYPGQPYQQQPYQQQPYPGQPYPPQPYGQPLPPGSKAAYTADGVPLAGWWWRALAIILDGFIVGVIAVSIASPIYIAVFNRMATYFRQALAAAEQGLPAPPQPPMETLITQSENLIIIMIGVAVEATYIIAFLRWKSATPGKLICGLRVVPVDQGRTSRLGWNSVIPRTVVWVIGGAAALLWLLRLLDILFPLWQPKRQALHDLAAKTQVVKIR